MEKKSKELDCLRQANASVAFRGERHVESHEPYALVKTIQHGSLVLVRI